MISEGSDLRSEIKHERPFGLGYLHPEQLEVCNEPRQHRVQISSCNLNSEWLLSARYIPEMSFTQFYCLRKCAMCIELLTPPKRVQLRRASNEPDRYKHRIHLV